MHDRVTGGRVNLPRLWRRSAVLRRQLQYASWLRCHRDASGFLPGGVRSSERLGETFSSGNGSSFKLVTTMSTMSILTSRLKSPKAAPPNKGLAGQGFSSKCAIALVSGHLPRVGAGI